MSQLLRSPFCWITTTLAAGLMLSTVPPITPMPSFVSFSLAAGLGGAGGAPGGAAGGVGGAAGTVGSAAGGGSGAVGNAARATGGAAGGALGGASSAVGGAAGAVGNVGSVAGGAASAAGGAVGGASSAVGGAAGAVGNVGSTAGGAAGGAVGNVGSTAGGAVGSAGPAGVSATGAYGAGTAAAGGVGPTAVASPSSPVGRGTASAPRRAAVVFLRRRHGHLFLPRGNGGEMRSSSAQQPPNSALSAALPIVPSAKSKPVKRQLAVQQVGHQQIASVAAVQLPNAEQGTVQASAYQEGVVIASGLTVSELAALIARKFSLLDIVDGPNTVYKLGIPPGIGTPTALELVRRTNPLIIADFDHFYTLADGRSTCSSTSCRPFQSDVLVSPQLLPCVNLPAIGMIDTAIDPQSKLFASATIVALGEEDTSTNDSHGTHIAALLAAAPDSKVPGLLPTARLIVYNAFASRDGRDVADAVSLVRAINSLVRADAKVVNISLVGPPNLLLKQAVDVALKQNTVIVAAAGNDGAGAKAAFPAGYDGVIAVTAVDDKLTGYEHATRASYITLAAPGVRLLTADSRSNADLMSGTSYAAPFVTAAAALLVAAQPDLSPSQVTKGLIADAKDLGRPGRDDTFGWGLLRSFDRCQPSDSVSLGRMPREITHNASARP
jgi:hypothetical protein